MRHKYWLSMLIVVALCVLPAYAEGDPNVEGGGGGMSGGHVGNYWPSSEYGVRITVISATGEKVRCFDWSSKDESNVARHFGKKSKYDYLHGSILAPSSGLYLSRKPSDPLPAIIRANGGSDIPAIKRYFTDTETVRIIAADAGLGFNTLVGGEYKILLEPMAYIVLGGQKYAVTAHEAALLDIQTGGKVYYWLRSLTHQNLPLAMYLEKSDVALGLYAPTGKPSGKQTNLSIINNLGIGIISFKSAAEAGTTPTGSGDVDYEFRCDTDVIVSFPIRNSGGDITPDDSAYVTLTVGGQTINRQYICPAGATQTIWVRWHTPSEPQELTATARGAGDSVTLSVRVVKLEEQTPPDPTFYDHNDNFRLVDTPSYGSCTSTSWGEWYADWIQEHGSHLGGYDPIYDWVYAGEKKVGEDEDGKPIYESVYKWKKVGSEPWYYTCTGYCKEHGHWDYTYVNYEAHLTCTFAVEPDDRCPTDYDSHGQTIMGSGYGVQVNVEPWVTCGAGVDSYDVTPIQNVVATFPEHEYKTYDRLLEQVRGVWHFKPNDFSLYESRIHYTPLWYPDDTVYPVAMAAFDCWTPGGQLYISGSDQVYIFQSALDDWYIHIVDEEHAH